MGELEPPIEPGPGPEPPQDEPAPEEPIAEAPAGPPAPPPRRRTAIAVVAVVVVVVVVLAAVWFLGIGPFARPATGPHSAPALSYGSAAANATAAAKSVGGGPWSVLFATGLDFASSVALDTSLPPGSSLGLGASCAAANVAGATSFVNLPSDANGASTGTSPSWVFFLAASNALLIVSVVGGQAEVWGELTGAGCSVFGLFGALPTISVDSPTAVASAMAAGGSRFVADHPGGNLSFSVAGGSDAWEINYTNCPGFVPPGAGAYWAFQAFVSVANGTVLGTPTLGATTCSDLGFLQGFAQVGLKGHLAGFGPPLGSVLTLADPAYLDGSSDWVINITAARVGVPIGNLTFEVAKSSGRFVTDLVEVDLDAASGCVLATGFLNLSYYSGLLFGNGLGGATQCTSGTIGNGAQLALGEKLVVGSSVPVSLQGDTFEAVGTTGYSSSVNSTLALGPSLATALSVNATAFVNATGDWIVNVTSASAGITIGDLGFWLVDAAGASVSAPLATVTLLATSGCILAVGQLNNTYYSAAYSGGGCSLPPVGAGAVVATGEKIVLSTGLGGHGSGDTLEILGWFHWSGTVRTSAP